MTTIVLDPGHGGRNRGARFAGYDEADLNLMLAEDAAKLMPWATVDLTRYADTLRHFYERGQVSQELNADLVICIHHNASKARTLRGPEFYVRAGDDVAMRAANSLARYAPLGDARVRVADPQDDDPSDDWLEAPRNVLLPHAPRPTILYEVGYMTNELNLRFMTSPWGRRMIAAFVSQIAARMALELEADRKGLTTYV